MTATARPRGRPPLDLDEEAVLEATLLEVAESGEAASMQRIADRAGVAKTTLHDRFGSKQSLVQQAIDRERRRLADHLIASYRDARGDIGPGVRIRRGYAALFDYARARPAALRLLFGAGGTRDVTTRSEVADEITALVHERFTALGLPLGLSGRVIAAVIVGAGESVARLVADDPDVDLAAVSELVAGLVSNGLANVDVRGLRAVDRASAQ